MSKIIMSNACIFAYEICEDAEISICIEFGDFEKTCKGLNALQINRLPTRGEIFSVWVR